MMACIYTNTHTCTTAERTCTNTVHMQTCMCLDQIWVRPHHCDQPVGFGGQVNFGRSKKKKKTEKKYKKRRVWFIISEVLRKLVRLWKRSALSFLLFQLVCSFCCCSESLSMVLPFAMWQTFALYISLFSSFTLLLKKKQLVFYLLFSLFCEVMPFIKAIDLLQCLNDPDLTHTPHKLYRLKINAQTIRGREMDKGG